MNVRSTSVVLAAMLLSLGGCEPDGGCSRDEDCGAGFCFQGLCYHDLRTDAGVDAGAEAIDAAVAEMGMERCDGVDNDADDSVDEGCGCAPGEQQECWPAALERRGVGECHDGQQICVADIEFGRWAECRYATVPVEEVPGNCVDEDCDGVFGGVSEDCSQAGDEDCDGLANCADPDCAGGAGVSEDCSQPGDEDCDGRANCLDPDCADERRCACVEPRVRLEGVDGSDAVDILWVVDASGSMAEEAELVEDELERFVDALIAESLDFRLILITREGFVQPPPAIAGDATRFHFIDARVDSHNSLRIALDTYLEWVVWLRAGARTHFVEVSDDDSIALPWEAFNDDLLLGLERSYRFHAVVSPPPSSCRGPYGGATSPGTEYWELAEFVGGTQQSICAGDWSPLVATIAADVARSTREPECRVGVPMDYAVSEVEVTFFESGVDAGVPLLESAECEGAGWRVIPGTERQLELCPESCALLAGSSHRYEVSFPCAVEGR